MKRSHQNSEKQESRCAAGGCQQLQSRSTASTTSSEPIAQLAKVGTGSTRNVTIKGKNDDKDFEECKYNYVQYNKGDAKIAGTGTKSPANWAKWVTNKKGGRNASQLHVVNKRWGGLGGQNDKNIVPGSPKENSLHLHNAEKIFDTVAFGGKGANAITNATYECWAKPSYGSSVDLSGGTASQDFTDPTLLVKITADSLTKPMLIPVPVGSEGLTLKDGSR